MAEQWIIFGHLDGNVKFYGRKLIIYGSNKKIGRYMYGIWMKQ